MITKVWITIDSEPSSKYENGCFDYCVNGVWPRDLSLWFAQGIATPTKRGYKLTPDSHKLLTRFYAKREASSRILDSAGIDRRIATADSGLPLIFSVLREFGAHATAFLDAAQLYVYGAALFREACEIIELSGNDLQLHLHAGSLGPRWFRQHGLAPQQGPIEQRETSDLLPLFSAALAEFNRFASKPPIAYRAGAYRVSDNVIDVLRNVGIGIDSSFDQLNKKGHMRIGQDSMRGNFPVSHRGVLEAPISAYRIADRDRILRFQPSRGDDRRIEALRAMNRAGVPLVTYILHSYSLMSVYGEGEEKKTGRLGADKTIISNFKRELEFISRSPDFELVSGAKELLEQAEVLVSTTATTSQIVLD